MLAQLANRINRGGADMTRDGIAALALLRGLLEDPSKGSPGSDKLHDYMQYWADRSAGWERLAQLGQTGPVAETLTNTVGGLIPVLPTLAIGSLGGQGSLAMALGMGASATQSAASEYAQAYATLRARGVPEAEARHRAQLPALEAAVW